jgi:hypothetical protein
MSDLATAASEPPSYRRGTKFTATNIRQIRNLLERGKTKEEIAEIIGVTVATLQVTCSKLGISLRRPTNNEPALGKLTHSSHVVASTIKEGGCDPAPGGNGHQRAGAASPVEAWHGTPKQAAKTTRVADSTPPPMGLILRHNGETRTVELAVDRNVLGLIALEAQFREMAVGDLISRILTVVGNSELLARVLRESDHRSG